MIRHLSKFVVSAGIAAIAVASTQAFSIRAAYAADMYGAIATNEDGAWGYAYNYRTRAQAEAEALKQCGQSDCEIRVWFANACGAVAENDSYLGWGWAESRAEAEAKALSACGKGDCKVITWACTDR